MYTPVASYVPVTTSVNRVMDSGVQYCIETEVCCQNYVAPLHELDEQL